MVQKRSTRQILKDNLARSAPEPMGRLCIWLHNIRSKHNVGAAFRSADAFGIDHIIISGYSPAPPEPEISKTALGAEENVDWKAPDKPANHALKLKSSGYKLIGIEQTTDSILLPDYKPTVENSLCLVFGNEVTGIDDELLPLIDQFVEIPQYGYKHSLNVSVSIGTVLYAMLEKFWPNNI